MEAKNNCPQASKITFESLSSDTAMEVEVPSNILIKVNSNPIRYTVSNSQEVNAYSEKISISCQSLDFAEIFRTGNSVSSVRSLKEESVTNSTGQKYLKITDNNFKPSSSKVLIAIAKRSDGTFRAEVFSGPYPSVYFELLNPWRITGVRIKELSINN
jgi:hypothetical protein